MGNMEERKGPARRCETIRVRVIEASVPADLAPVCVRIRNYTSKVPYTHVPSVPLRQLGAKEGRTVKYTENGLPERKPKAVVVRSRLANLGTVSRLDIR